MKLFVSYSRNDHNLIQIRRELERRGFIVYTNHDDEEVADRDRRADLRLRRIRESDAFIFIAPADKTYATLRTIEYGYALGTARPVAFIGVPKNTYHRWGDVFADIDEFLAGWPYEARDRPSAKAAGLRNAS